MSFKNYGKQFVKAAKRGRDFTTYKGAVPIKGKFNLLNPWWKRRRHPGWAAYHANKDKI